MWISRGCRHPGDVPDISALTQVTAREFGPPIRADGMWSGLGIFLLYRILSAAELFWQINSRVRQHAHPHFHSFQHPFPPNSPTSQLPNSHLSIVDGAGSFDKQPGKKKTGHCLAKTLGSHWNRERRRSSRNGVTARFRFRFRSTSGSRDSDWAREIAHKNTNANSKIQTDMKSKFHRWRSNRECS